MPDLAVKLRFRPAASHFMTRTDAVTRAPGTEAAEDIERVPF